MNIYFVSVTADLDLKRDSETFYGAPASVYNIKKKFQDHQSILKIKKAFNVTDSFSFHEVTEDEIRKKNSKLDGSKAIFCLMCQRSLKKSCISKLKIS